MGAKPKLGRGTKPIHKQNRPGLLVEAAENIEEGAGLLGERVSTVAERTVEIAGGVLDALKGGLSQAYEAGAKAVDEATKVAQEYARKYKQNAEIRRLGADRDQLTARLGFVAYRNFKNNKWSLELLSDEPDARAMYEEIGRLNAEVVKIGRQLELESRHGA
jgi:predicted transcriptional regulator of viral defense system